MKINEISMAPSNLKAEAAKLTNARVGIEFELIVKNVGHYAEDEEFNSEPDYQWNESVTDSNWTALSRDIMNFFRGEHNTRRDVEHALEAAERDYAAWHKEQWQEYVEANLKDWVEHHYPDDANDPNMHLDDFEEMNMDDFNDDEGGVSRWVENNDVATMREFGDRFDLNWPHWTEPDESSNQQIGEGDRDFDQITDSFADAVGMTTVYNTDYAGGNRGITSYVMEPDGSLKTSVRKDYGLEFISPPMSVGEMIKHIGYVKDWAIEQGNAYTNATCGLHMNVSFPGFDLADLDYVKLAVFLGDNWVSAQFGRVGNTYARSSIDFVKDRIKNDPSAIPHVIEHLKKSLSLEAGKIIHRGTTDKYMSINTKENRVEFRSPGGNWLEKDTDLVVNTMLRCVVALSIALDPEKEKKEYASKLYKLISPKTDDAIGLFALYQSGQMTPEQLKQRWARLILTPDNKKEPAQKATNLAKKITGRRWWHMIRGGHLNGETIAAFQAPTWDEALDKAKEYAAQHHINDYWELKPAIHG